MREKRENKALNLFRLAAAFLVVAIHISPLSKISQNADFFITRILARTAVPFFFMVTGQFLFTSLSTGSSPAAGAAANVSARVRKLVLLYIVAILLYLPIGIYAGLYEDMTAAGILRMFFFDGTFYHLWYFPACILGILLVFLLLRLFSVRTALAVCLLLYLIGLFGDSYYGLIEGIPAVNAFYSVLFRVSSYTRNGLFFAPLFLLLGSIQNRKDLRFSPSVRGIGLLLSLTVLTAEGFLLHSLEAQRHDSMYLALIPCMIFLYQCLLSCRSEGGQRLRPFSTWIYLLHPAAIVAVRGFAKLTRTTAALVDDPLIHYLMVCALTLLASAGAVFVSSILSGLPFSRCSHLKTRFRPKPSAGTCAGPLPPHASSSLSHSEPFFPTGRAWIELDRAALEHNVEILRSYLPPYCRLMPAVKADAYGHGAVNVCKILNECGVDAFCVASLQEGITLREHGIAGEILILGYTHPSQFPLLGRYHLTQTVLDLPYARELEKYGKRLHVHIGIDTGMHRLGERVENIEAIRQILRIRNLSVDGLFTHLCASDTDDPLDEAYTRAQAEAFYALVKELKKEDLPCPKIHLQASYGILNYPEFAADLARPGILLYGMLSTRADTLHCPLPLMPVLSVKARVASIRTLCAGESAGYGLQFTASRDTQIAALSIGYADGLPRALSCGVGSVLIDGRRAPVIGRICMDQTLVDITGIPDVAPGSVAVIVGRSGEKEIAACDLAEQAHTITNEILSRLGSRLERVVV